ncbi:nickel-dependent lactate racemase [Thermodesulfobacteriota bacterium]
MKKYFIRYGHEKIFFDVPESWNVLTLASFEDNVPARDITELTRHALKNPVETMPLEKQLNSSSKVALLIEDNTRNSPKKYILRYFLTYLDSLSISPENISIIVALGTHKELSGDELERTYGEDLVKKYCFYNHDCLADDLVPVGKLESGTTVKINRLAYEADFRVGIGSIFPHPLNGFGGGGKIMFPGVANFEAILEHHLKYCFRNIVLGSLKANPFYEVISSLAEKGKLDFIINSVLDHNDDLNSVVAGHPVHAHRAGADICKKIITRGFSQKADITIISAFPYTQALQLMKPLEAASIITSESGVIILAGECTTVFPGEYLDACSEFRKNNKGKLETSVFDCFENNRRIIEHGAPELNMSLAQVLLAIDKYRVILFSKEVPGSDVEKLGFVHAKTIEEAIEISNGYINKPSVHIVPSGGVIIPEIH